MEDGRVCRIGTIYTDDVQANDNSWIRKANNALQAYDSER